MAETDDRPLIEQLREKRNEKRTALKTAITERDAVRAERDKVRADFEGRVASATEEQVAEFRTAEEAYATDEDNFAQTYADAKTEIKRLSQRIKEQRDLAKRQKEAAKANKGTATNIKEPATYNRGNADKVSWLRDLAVASDRRISSTHTSYEAAVERLNRHAAEMEVEMPKREAKRAKSAEKDIESAEKEFRHSVGLTGTLEDNPFRRRDVLGANPYEYRVEPNRTDGQGGYFVPPLWLVDEYIPGLRAGRVAAGLCRNMDLPPGTDSINIPKLSTLTQVGVQGADNQAVTDQDFTDTAVTANVKTLAGQEDIAIQLLEQSPGQIIDQVIMNDLIADYNRLVDRQVIYGNGQNASSLNGGQVLGIYPQSNWSGTNTVTYTSASPKGYDYAQVLGAMASQVSYNRYDLSSFHFLMHPRRWFWYATSLDGNNRPLVESNDFGPWNVAALTQANVPFEGLAGQTPFGPMAYIDANVPTTDNGSGASGGTNDVAIGANWNDLWLFEGELRTRVLPEILSGTLSLRYQVYAYVAFLTRYGQSIAIAEGTGFAAPTGTNVSSILF